jgi:hypothetical protein
VFAIASGYLDVDDPDDQRKSRAFKLAAKSDAVYLIGSCG